MSENSKNLECKDVEKVAIQSEALSARTSNSFERDLFGIVAAFTSSVGSLSCKEEKNITDAKTPADTPQVQPNKPPSNAR